MSVFSRLFTGKFAVYLGREIGVVEPNLEISSSRRWLHDVSSYSGLGSTSPLPNSRHNSQRTPRSQWLASRRPAITSPMY